MESTASPAQIRQFQVRKGDVAITKDSETSEDVGRPAYIARDLDNTVYGYHLAIYRPYDPRYGRFIRYLFDDASIRADLRDRTPGVTRVGLSQDTLRHLKVPVPSPSVAGAVADYLDRETAEIDAFIAEQQSFGSVTHERLSSLAYALATGGQGAGTGSTSNFWGTLPSGWSLEKIGWHSTVRNGMTPKSDNPRFWHGGSLPWVNSSVVNRTVVTEPSRLITNDAFKKLSLPMIPAGSLLMGLTGQGKTRGMVSKLGIETTINQHVAALTPRRDSRLGLPYLQLALTAAYKELRQLSDGNGGTKGAITCEMLQQFKVPVPPADEQLSLAGEYRIASELTSELEQMTVSAILLAKERRAALISAAVTGQIDVTARNKPAVEQLQDELEGK